MTQRENILSLLRRDGYEFIPPEFSLCDFLVEEYNRQTNSPLSYRDYFNMSWRVVEDIRLPDFSGQYRSFYPSTLHPDTRYDVWGIAHEPGSAEAHHMTRMYHPLQGMTELAQLREYPMPDFGVGDSTHQRMQVDALHQRGLAANGYMHCTIWETSWYLRGMEDLMVDMMLDDPNASYVLDYVTEQATLRAVAFARAGVDLLDIGDDIGTQRGIMMSHDLYRKWLKPRLTHVISAARAVKPDLVVMYHSCGHVTPFIDDLIQAGITVLNPIQSECMNWREVVAAYRDRLSFYGCIGTQSLMPFGTRDEIIREVRACIAACGSRGGMLPAPTHLLEPEVPWNNILAYVEGCTDA